MSEADKKHEGGNHYRTDFWQTWNLIIPMEWSAFQFEIINYVDRYKRKNGIEDLKKARHWLDKLIEIEEGTLSGTRQLGEGFSISPVPNPIEGSPFLCKDCNKEFSPRNLCTCGGPTPLTKMRPLPPQINGANENGEAKIDP